MRMCWWCCFWCLFLHLLCVCNPFVLSPYYFLFFLFFQITHTTLVSGVKWEEKKLSMTPPCFDTFLYKKPENILIDVGSWCCCSFSFDIFFRFSIYICVCVQYVCVCVYIWVLVKYQSNSDGDEEEKIFTLSSLLFTPK